MRESLGQYRILDRIGTGALGDIYRARDTRRGRTVALRVVADAIANDPANREALIRAARAASAVSHPNIAALYDIGDDQGEWFLAFEFVPGETLKNAIAGRPLNPRRAIDLAAQIADALAEAHAAGLVHGRLATDTIIITPKGNAKILDLGFAAWSTVRNSQTSMPADAGAATNAAVPSGTDVSPERADFGLADDRLDVFSLGTVLFEMLTGGTASSAAPSLPGELDAIVSRALAPDPLQRYESVATMAADLRHAAASFDARSEKSEPSHAVRVPRPARGRGFAPVILVLVSIAVVAGVSWWQHAAIERIWRHSMGAPPRPVIAVMPLAMSVVDPSQAFIADGLSEDLATRLGQTPGITVLGRSAVRTYRNRAPNDVARDLGAGVVLSGTLRRDRDAVTLALMLADRADGTSLWSADYTRDVREIFALEAQVAEDIAQALHLPVRLSAATARSSSRRVDPAAYELYLHGRDASSAGYPAEAVKFFDAAVTTDAGLPEAFAGLARSLQALGSAGKSNEAARRDRIRNAAERAYELDPDLASANVAMAFGSTSLPQILQYFKRAIDLDPSNGDTYRDVSDVIRFVAPDLSASFNQRALTLDPQPAVGRVPATAWRPVPIGREKLAEATSRDRDLVRGALAGVLDARQ